MTPLLSHIRFPASIDPDEDIAQLCKDLRAAAIQWYEVTYDRGNRVITLEIATAELPAIWKALALADFPGHRAE